MDKLKIILDPAHGSDTPGKRSPDGSHLEYSWSRKMLCLLEVKLLALEYDVHWTNPTDLEIGLGKRVAKANEIPGSRKLLISLHNNAAGMGDKWMNATGYSIYTTKGKTKSDMCAEIMLKEFRDDFPELRGRFDTTDGDLDNEANFTVLTGKTYMAVLIEWLFQDNKSDVALLKDEALNERLIECLCLAIAKINYEVT